MLTYWFKSSFYWVYYLSICPALSSFPLYTYFSCILLNWICYFIIEKWNTNYIYTYYFHNDYNIYRESKYFLPLFCLNFFNSIFNKQFLTLMKFNLSIFLLWLMLLISSLRKSSLASQRYSPVFCLKLYSFQLLVRSVI